MPNTVSRRRFVGLATTGLVSAVGGSVLAACAATPAAPATSSGVAATGGSTKESSLARAKRVGFLTMGYTPVVPWVIVDPNNAANVTGLDAELLKLIVPKLGIKDIQPVPTTSFAGLIPGLLAGRFDVLGAGLGVRPDRCQQIDFSEPTVEQGSTFGVKKGNPLNLHSYKDVASNPKARLGVVQGGQEVNVAKAVGVPDGQVTVIDTSPNLVEALRAGRVDAISGTAVGLPIRLKATNDPNIEAVADFVDAVINGRPDESVSAYGIRKEDSDLTSAINDALKGFKADGTLRSLLQKFEFPASVFPKDSTTTASLCKP